ncbi:Cell division protein FtsL [Moorella humiferrea]
MKKMGKVVRLPKRSLNWRVIAAGMLTLYFFFSFIRLGVALYQTNLQIKSYNEQKALLEAEGNRLREQIRELNDNDYIERLAREELGLVKPGETVVITAVPGQVRPYIPPRPGQEFRD